MAAPPVKGQSQEKPESELRVALAGFIRAFDDLDWDHFRLTFLDDATVFYPREMPRRATGRAEFETGFRRVFEQIRAGRTTPPYMDIRPRSLKVQVLGDTAIVTFHLDDRRGFVNRRTMLWKRTERGWKIAHLHASEVAVAQP